MTGAGETTGNQITISVRAPAATHRSRKFLMGLFPMSAPVWNKEGNSYRLHQEKLDLRRHPDSSTHPWVLERRKGDAVQRGTYEAGLSSKEGAGYFVIVKEGNEAMAIPVEQWFSFKPIVRRDNVTLEQVEAEMAGQRQSMIPTHLIPKSIEEMIANKNTEELKKEGISFSNNMVQLFGEDDDDKANRRRRGGGGGAGGSRAAAQRDDIDPDEMPEDIFAGENDELRPERPDNAEDWEHDRQADDDDLDQGEAEEEKLEDDPGLRKKLGLVEDEEELDDQGKAINQILKQEEEEDEEDEKEEDEKPEGAAAVKPDPDEEMKDEDEDIDDDQDLDELAEEHEKGSKRARTPPRGARAQTPPPQAQRKTPPPSQPAAAAKRRPSPGPDPDAKAAKRVKQEPAPARAATPPPRTGTPPPAPAQQQQQQQRKSPSPAPAAASAAAAVPTAGSGVPSNEEIIAALRAGHNTTKAIVSHFKNRCAGSAAAEFKERLLKLVKVQDDGKGGKVLALKDGVQ